MKSQARQGSGATPLDREATQQFAIRTRNTKSARSLTFDQIDPDFGEGFWQAVIGVNLATEEAKNCRKSLN